MYSLKISEHLNNSKYGIKNEPTLQPLGYNFLPAAKGLSNSSNEIHKKLLIRVALFQISNSDSEGLKFFSLIQKNT